MNFGERYQTIYELIACLFKIGHTVNIHKLPGIRQHIFFCVLCKMFFKSLVIGSRPQKEVGIEIMTGSLPPSVINIFHGEEKIKIEMAIFRDIFYNSGYLVKGMVVVICFNGLAHHIDRKST